MKKKYQTRFPLVRPLLEAVQNNYIVYRSPRSFAASGRNIHTSSELSCLWLSGSERESQLGVGISILFAQARIKKIMQTDEDVGKIAIVTPILICSPPTGFSAK